MMNQQPDPNDDQDVKALQQQQDNQPLTANEWLMANGHNNGGMCEKCWSEAHLAMLSGAAYESKTEAYYAISARCEAEALAAVQATNG